MRLIVNGNDLPCDHVTSYKATIKDVIATEEQSESGKDFVEYARRNKVSIEIEYKHIPASEMRSILSATDGKQFALNYDLYGVRKDGYFRRGGGITPSLVMQTNGEDYYNFTMKMEEY